MSSFVYSPEIIVRIEGVDPDSDTGTTVFDVSHDIVSATIDRRNSGVSSFNLNLSNRGRKYDGAFAPMNRVSIYLRRIGPPLLVLSGYLDAVPAFSTHSGPVRLRGSCTLKRLQHWYWDPGSMASADMLSRPGDADHGDEDGGVARRIVEVLTKVGGWHQDMIHIAAVPSDWLQSVSDLGADEIARAEHKEMMEELGGTALLGGSNGMRGVSSLPGVGPGTGELPGHIQTVGVFGGRNGRSGRMSLTDEPIRMADSERASHGGEYYIAARWPYRVAIDGRVADGVDLSAAEAWWRGRRILLVNPRSNRAVVVRAAHWGPPAGSAVSTQVSRAAFDALGMGSGDGNSVHMSFATDTMQLGPASPGNNVGSTLGAVPGAARSIIGAGIGAASVARYGRPPRQPGSTFAQLESLLAWADERGYNVAEHPAWGGVHPGAHLKPSQGGWHHWPEATGGGAAADITWPGGGQEYLRKLDELAAEVCRRGLGCIWRSHGHFRHVHVDISLNRRMGNLVYASLAGNVIPTPIDNVGVLGSGVGPGDYAPGAPVGSAEQLGMSLFSAFEYMSDTQASTHGQMLGGPRAIMNDVPLFGTIDELMKAGLRDWCSAPNGDIIGWFPDYFGRFGTAAKMIVEPVEITADGFTAEWSDDRLKTHVFVTGALSNVGGFLQGATGNMSANQVIQMEKTAGIASVEFPEMMRVLFDLDTEMFADKGKGFLSRFGARPENVTMNNIHGPRAEFFFSVYKFMQNWSNQYSAKISTTFLPEMYPGMLAVFPYFGVQAYVQGVTHNIDMTGGGFRTTLNLTAWSRIGNREAAIKGLPKGGDL